jgi:hypothetical protein
LASAVTAAALDEEEDRVGPDQIAVGGTSLASTAARRSDPSTARASVASPVRVRRSTAHR